MKSPVTFFTSFLFGITGFMIHNKPTYHYDIIGCCICVMITSLFYHYTHNPTIRIIDMIVVHFSMLYGGYTLMSNHIYYYISCIIAIYMAIIYKYFNINDYTHATLHIMGNMLILLTLESYLANLKIR